MPGSSRAAEPAGSVHTARKTLAPRSGRARRRRARPPPARGRDDVADELSALATRSARLAQARRRRPKPHRRRRAQTCTDCAAQAPGPAPRAAAASSPAPPGIPLGAPARGVPRRRAPASGSSSAPNARSRCSSSSTRGDIVHGREMSERPVLPRNRGPLIAAVVAGAGRNGRGVVRSGPVARGAAPEADGTRNSACPRRQRRPATAGARACCRARAGRSGPHQRRRSPQRPPVEPAPQARRYRAPPWRSPTRRQARGSRPPRGVEPAPAKPERESTRSKARQARGRARAMRPPGTPGQSRTMPDSVEEAREALRALESEPVIKIKPALSSERRRGLGRRPSPVHRRRRRNRPRRKPTRAAFSQSATQRRTRRR